MFHRKVKTLTADGAGTPAIVNTRRSGLNVRPYPALLSQPILSIPKGARLVVQGREGDWFLITYHGLQGYVYQTYVLPLDKALSEKTTE